MKTRGMPSAQVREGIPSCTELNTRTPAFAGSGIETVINNFDAHAHG